MNEVNVLEVGPSNFGRGGLSTIAWNWYEKFDHDKIKVDFFGCCPSMPDAKYIEYLEKNGGTFFQYYCSGALRRQIKKVLFVHRLVKTNKYDCIHIHGSDAFEIYTYYLAVKNSCINIIVHSHSTAITGNSRVRNAVKSLLHEPCRRLLSKKNMVRLACSRQAAEWSYSKGDQYSVIKNGIEVSKFIFNEQVRQDVRDKLNLQNQFIIGHIGKFSFIKNHTFLLDVFHEVYKNNPNAVLLLIGEGEEENRIREKAHSLGLDEAVIFYGTAPNANELYQAMDCFVFPSHFEGLGIAAIESQAAGLKTLCSEGIPKEAQITELLEYLPLSESPENWAKKILSYSDNYERKNMSESIRLAGYDIEQSAKQLEALYCPHADESQYT